MEDVPEKLRRNVMFIGSLIICTWLFDLTFKTTGTILGLIEVGNISPGKLWLSLLTVLAYIFLRHAYSDQVKSDLKLMKTEHQNLRIKSASRTLNKNINRYFKTGRTPKWLPNIIPGRPNEHFPFKKTIFKISVTSLDSTCASGEIRLAYKVLSKNGDEFSSMVDNNLYSFTLSQTERVKAFIISATRTATISKAAVDVLIPFAIAGTGLAICTYKLIVLYLPTTLSLT